MPVMTHERVKQAALFLLYGGVALLCFLPLMFPGGILTVDDSAHCYLPDFLNGPYLINPHLALGYPTFSNPDGATFYPLRLFLQLVGVHLLKLPLLSFNLYLLLTYAMAGLFCHLFLRKLTGRFLPSLFGGLTYMLGSAMGLRWEHPPILNALAWWPLLLLAMEMARERPGKKPLAIGALAVGMMILGSHPQYWIYVVLASAVYGLFRLPNEKKAAFAGYVTLMFALGVLIGAAQALPTLELYGSFGRAGMDYVGTLENQVEPVRFLHAVAPRFPRFLFWNLPTNNNVDYQEVAFYFGLAPFLLALYALFFVRMPRSLRAWLMVAMGLAVCLALGDRTPLARWLASVPVVGNFRCLGRALFICVMGGVISSAIAMEHLLTTSRVRPVFLWLLVAVTVVDLALFNQFAGGHLGMYRSYSGHFPAGDALSDLRAEKIGYQRVVDLSDELLKGDRASVHKIDVASNMRSWDDESLDENFYLRLLSAMRGEIPGSHLPALMGVRYSLQLNATARPPLPGWERRPFADERFQLYERTGSRGVAWVVPSTSTASRKRILEEFQQERVDPYERAFVEHEPKTPASAGGTVNVAGRSRLSWTMEAQTTGPSFLVFSERHHPAWRVWVDGQPAKVERTNGLFLGVPLPTGGKHTIVWRFLPWSLAVGCLVSALGLGFVVFLLRRAERGNAHIARIPKLELSGLPTNPGQPELA